MARGRNRFSGKQSYKNVVDTNGSLAANTTSVNIVAQAVSFDVLDVTLNEVPVGARLSAIYYTLYVFSDATSVQDSLVNVFWAKDPASALALPNPGATGASDAKRFIIHEEKGLAGNRTNGMPMIVKGVVRIPYKLGRFGINDSFVCHIRAPVNGLFCLKHIYRCSY